MMCNDFQECSGVVPIVSEMCERVVTQRLTCVSASEDACMLAMRRQRDNYLDSDGVDSEIELAE